MTDDGWQPIETAPKRGERLLLWVPKTNKGLVFGKWRAGPITHSKTLEAWWLEGYDLPFDEEPYMPTHWMLPPEPPK